jgi:hypothetical protein
VNGGEKWKIATPAPGAFPLCRCPFGEQRQDQALAVATLSRVERPGARILLFFQPQTDTSAFEGAPRVLRNRELTRRGYGDGYTSNAR